MNKQRYEVIGTLNNNGVVAKDELNKEVILLGKGIGFKRKAGDVIENPGKNIKCYGLEKTTGKNVLQGVDPIFLEIANEIIRYAEKVKKDKTKSALYGLDNINTLSANQIFRNSRN